VRLVPDLQSVDAILGHAAYGALDLTVGSTHRPVDSERPLSIWTEQDAMHSPTYHNPTNGFLLPPKFMLLAHTKLEKSII
jgi:hypothetical protein